MNASTNLKKIGTFMVIAWLVFRLEATSAGVKISHLPDKGNGKDSLLKQESGNGSFHVKGTNEELDTFKTNIRAPTSTQVILL